MMNKTVRYTGLKVMHKVRDDTQEALAVSLRLLDYARAGLILHVELYYTNECLYKILIDF